jgi:hypothetical protein
MKWLETRKPFNPKPAEKIPRTIRALLTNSRTIFFTDISRHSGVRSADLLIDTCLD